MPTDDQIRDAADRLQETVALKSAELADELLGRPEIGTPEWTAEAESRDTPDGRRRLKEWHLVKLQIAREAGVSQTGVVVNARYSGARWEEIGEACGITRQAAHDRWAKHAASYDQMLSDRKKKR